MREFLVEELHDGLFPHMKMKLKGGRFETIQEIQKESQAALQAATKSVCENIFQQWEKM